ncbi:MAG: HAMP domain-containing protein [Firmicutes bacterium]|nr:HAMP domain-containing protein [Bacillota bacterium]
MSQFIFLRVGGQVIILKNKIKWFYSLRFKLILSYMLISFIPLVIFSFFITNSIKNYFKNDRSKYLLTDANIIARNISKGDYFFGKNINLFDEELEKKSLDGAYRILVLNKFYYVINDSNNTATGKVYIIPEVIDAIKKKDQSILRADSKQIYTCVPILNKNSEPIGTVLIISSAKEIFLIINQIQQKLFFLMGIIFAIIFISALFISHLIINPLKKILDVINKISLGHLNERIKIDNKDEFAKLAFSFNKMTDKLNQTEIAREEFVSNVSHELKTPLSAIKVLTESMLNETELPVNIYREFLGDINSEIDRMTNIVNDLLTLVKLDKNRSPLNISSVNFNNMLENIIKRLLPLAAKKNILLELTHETNNIFLQADEVKLSLAISNLIDNGIKYTPPNGKVKININADENFCYLAVQDNGIGINEAEQNKIFDRFYRIDKTRDRETGGTGLGLAITRSTILMHKGEISLTSQEGLGTTFFIKLPLRFKFTKRS